METKASCRDQETWFILDKNVWRMIAGILDPCSRAMLRGVLRYFRDLIDDKVTHSYIKPMPLQLWHSTSSSTINWAALLGYWKVIQWGRKHNWVWSDSTSSEAARGGHLHMLNWLILNGCPYHRVGCCVHAARNGHLSIVKTMWDPAMTRRYQSHVVDAAVETGQLMILKWLADNAPDSVDYVRVYTRGKWYKQQVIIDWAGNHLSESTKNLLDK